MSDSSLAQFIANHQAAWLSAHQHLPLTARDDASTALGQRYDVDLYHWQAQPMSEQLNFDNIEDALSLTLHPSLSAFYGQFFAAELPFSAEFGEGELLLLWNDEDLTRLQENLIGHLLMKQKLKQDPTLFIGVIDNSEKMIVLDNSDGSVWLEIPGAKPHLCLANSLDEFIDQLAPRVQWPDLESEDEQAPTEVQGLGARMWAMLSHLWPKR